MLAMTSTFEDGGHFEKPGLIIVSPLHNVHIEQLKFLALVCAWTGLKKCQKIHERTYFFLGANNCEENREKSIFVSFKL